MSPIHTGDAGGKEAEEVLTNCLSVDFFFKGGGSRWLKERRRPKGGVAVGNINKG